MHCRLQFLLAAFPLLASAWAPPSYSGFGLLWNDQFNGGTGTSPNGGNWNTVIGLHTNNDIQEYTSSTRNLQVSGGGTLQIVPWREANGGWTSARVESKYTFTPPAGKVTFAESQIRFGGNAVGTKKGLWPAFWLLGDAMRHGTAWPRCGELDVMETVNGALTGYGTVHCDAYPGGRCNEPTGIGATTGLPDQGWHTWRIRWDRSSNNWQSETITWFRDGQQFHQISGSRIGDQAVWATLCHSPLYFILNMAVGGNWPGNPDGNTQGGYGSMMEVAYVAVYSN